MLLETEQIFKPHVECAVIGVEQHDPAERVGQWRNRHVGKHGNLDNGSKRHVGSLDEPGQHSGQYESEKNAASGVVSRIEKKSQRRRIAIGCGEVPKGYAQGIKRQRSGGQQAAPQQNHKRRRNQDYGHQGEQRQDDLLLCEQRLAAHRYRFIS